MNHLCHSKSFGEHCTSVTCILSQLHMKFTVHSLLWISTNSFFAERRLIGATSPRQLALIRWNRNWCKLKHAQTCPYDDQIAWLPWSRAIKSFQELHSRIMYIRVCIQKFSDWVDNKIYVYNSKTGWEATRRIMAAKFNRLTHKIAIQLHLVAESCTICSSSFRPPVRKLLDTPLFYSCPRHERKVWEGLFLQKVHHCLLLLWLTSSTEYMDCFRYLSTVASIPYRCQWPVLLCLNIGIAGPNSARGTDFVDVFLRYTVQILRWTNTSHPHHI